jgi:hypothetical protein
MTSAVDNDRQPRTLAKLRAIAAYMLVIVAGAGCGSAAYSVAPSHVPTPISKQTNAANVDPQREVRELVIERRYLRQDPDKGLVVFEPDSDRQRTSYEHYVFAEDEWARVVANAAAPSWTKVRVRVEVLAERTTRSTPEPNMPSPDGGFRHVEIQCRPLQLVAEP